jgi:uncharacterized protein YcfL
MDAKIRILSAIILLFILNGCDKQTSPDVKVVSPDIIVTENVKESANFLSESPEWHGVIPGETNSKQVIDLIGFPDISISCNSGELDFSTWGGANVRFSCEKKLTIYIYDEIHIDEDYPTFKQVIRDEVYFQEDAVFLIIEDTAVHGEEYLYMEDFLNIHGEPDTVTWSSFKSGGHRMYWYCDEGLIVNTSGNIIFRKLYFEPRPYKFCLETFQAWGPLEDPFQD